MWLFHWMTNLIPDGMLMYFYYFIIILGIGLFAFGKLCQRWSDAFNPAVIAYSWIAEVLGVLLLVLGIYLFGGYKTEMAWRERVAEAEAAVQKAQEESKILNKKLEKERKKKQKVRVKYYEKVRTEIKQVEKQINGPCKLDPKVNELHNKAAHNPETSK